VPPQRVSRFDVAEIGKPVRTPQGFLRVPAYLTRVGVFAYKRADGTTVRELRPADEVFAEDSLATLSSAPLTDLHPTEMVSPANVRKLRIGHVGEAVRKDGRLVSAHITVEDHEAIAKVESGERREISCGYKCRIDATPGEHEGERYDVVQRDIVYNHAALGPRNWGRLGADVRLRVDGGGDAGDELVFRLDSEDAVSAQTHSAPSSERKDEADDMDMATIRVDGIDVQVLKQGGAQQLIEKALKERSDALDAAKKQLDQLQGKFDAQTGELTKTKQQLAEATDPKRLDAAVNARAALLEQARRVLPAETKVDGLTPRQVHEAVLKTLDEKTDLTGKSDDYVLARFDAAIAGLPTDKSDAAGGGGHRSDALDNARRNTSPGATPRQDSAPAPPALAEWQKPLAYSKDAS
jgi:hypothetical protein